MKKKKKRQKKNDDAERLEEIRRALATAEISFAGTAGAVEWIRIRVQEDALKERESYLSPSKRLYLMGLSNLLSLVSGKLYKLKNELSDAGNF